MSTRKTASLDGSLLARKGDAAPAVPDDPPMTGGPDAAQRRAPLFARRDEAAAAPPSTVGSPARTARFAPMTTSRRGLIGLVSVALLAVALIVTERLSVPADQPADPAVAVASAVPGAPVSDTAAAKIPAKADAPPVPEPAAVESIMKPASPPVESVLEPAAPPPAPPAPKVEQAITAAVVSDAPPPVPAPAKPAKKPVRQKSASVRPTAATRRYLLQLAAFSSEKAARGEAARLQKRLGSILGRRKVVVIRAARRDGKTVFRLRTAGYRTLAAARAACDHVHKLKTGCLVIVR